MRRVLATSLALGLAMAVSGAAWAECVGGHVKQQSVQAPTTSTTTTDTTAPVSKPKG